MRWPSGRSGRGAAALGGTQLLQGDYAVIIVNEVHQVDVTLDSEAGMHLFRCGTGELAESNNFCTADAFDVDNDDIDICVGVAKACNCAKDQSCE